MQKLLAFVDIFVESQEMDNVLASLIKLENLHELYEVTGEFDIVTLVSAADIEEFQLFLKLTKDQNALKKTIRRRRHKFSNIGFF